MNYTLAVYGDSIAFGYGNYSQSWFDYLSVGVSALKLAQNGEKIADVLGKIQKDTNHYNTLILAVGVNDLLQSVPARQYPFTSLLIEQYSNILEIAKKIAKNVVVQSVLPVIEELFPQQEWLDEKMWVFNETIATFNYALKELCKCYEVKYIDVYSEFFSLSVSDIYVDAVHLNNVGQQKLYEFYRKSARKL